MRNILLLFIAFLPLGLIAQLIETDPPFPRADQPVTITFDARLGSGGLAGYTGDVYAHTGVITNESNGPSDWKHVKTNWGQNTPATRMTEIAPDIYELEIGPTIEDYYNVSGGEEVLQLAFVFRSDFPVGGGQYLEGKTADFGDIFVDVYSDNSGLLMKVSLPEDKDLIVLPGQQIPIRIFTSVNAEITLESDGGELASESGVNVLDYNYSAPASGSSSLIVRAEANAEVRRDTIHITVIEEPEIAELPAGSKLGPDYPDGQRLRLVLEAPGKDFVIVRGSFTDWKFSSDHFMKRTPDGQFFWIEVEGLEEGQYYTYEYAVEGELRIADPLSEVVLDPIHDPFIDNELFPDLPSHPQRAAGERVTLIKAGGFDYNWLNQVYIIPEEEDLVVYEILMRDFLADHSYESLRDTLSYLRRLGVNAIELMPVNEFEGNLSWGYNPSYHMAIDKYYGSPDLLKAFIDEAHGMGMAVIMDVVFNHAFSQSPLAQLYWNPSQNRPAADNPWLNQTARHPFNVGYDFNHQSESTQRYMDRALSYLLEEYRVDGFRFDLSKGFTQNFSSDVGQWSQRDNSRIALLKRVADHVWSLNPNAYVILEHFADNSEETELANYGMMIWGNMHFNFKQASMSYHSSGDSDFRGAWHETRGWNDPHLIAYMESHDEERIMYLNEQFGNSSGGYDIKQQSTALDRVELSNVFMYSIPGPKMLWQFGELGYDFSINRCTNGTVNEDCRLTPKPIRWDYQAQPDRRDLFDVTRDMIYLKTRTALNDATITAAEWRDPFKFLRLEGGELNAMVLGNFDVQDQSLTVDFPHTGKWYEYFSGDSINIGDLSRSFTFDAGEYELYTDERILRPSVHGLPTSVHELVPSSRFGMRLFPNPIPSNSAFRVVFDPQRTATAYLSIFSPDGRLLYRDAIEPSELARGQLERDISLKQGFYQLRFEMEGQSASLGFMVSP